MSRLKCYFDLMSQPSRALWMTLKLSKTPFEECPIALRKLQQNSAQYKQINRFQKVPCIVEGDFQLGESIAIVRYLAAKNQLSDQLYPKCLHERARIDEYLGWHHLAMRYGCASYFLEQWLLPLMGKSTTSEREAQLLKQMEHNLKDFEKYFLNDSKFISSNTLTVADLFAATEIEQTKLTPYNINAQFPRIAEWLQHVRAEANPYYDQAHKNIMYLKVFNWGIVRYSMNVLRSIQKKKKRSNKNKSK